MFHGIQLFILMIVYEMKLIIVSIHFCFRTPENLLTLTAWEWPTRHDFMCQYHLNDLRSKSDSFQSKSMASGDVIGSRTHSNVSYYYKNSPIPPPSAHGTKNYSSQSATSSWIRSNLDKETAASRSIEADSILSGNGKLSSYDPRSADTVSVRFFC